MQAEFTGVSETARITEVRAQLLLDHLRGEEKRLRKMLKRNRRAQEHAAVVSGLTID